MQLAQMSVLHLAVCLLALISPIEAYIEGLYCGNENCYDVLEVDRSVSKGEIAKSYRKLAKKHHPDLQKDSSKKKESEVQFQRIANAYEVLRDEDSRRDYDYMLDNPDEYYQHYFYYYRRRVTPKVDVRVVIGVTISIISFLQYWSAWNNYNTAINYLVTVPKYRIRAADIARSQGLIDAKKKKDRHKTKEEIREEEENILKEVIKDKMDIRGGYQKPSVCDILWIQLVLLPYHIVLYIHWYCRWIWKFTICKEEYGDEEKKYLIRKNMKRSQTQFEALEDPELEKLMREELWKPEKFEIWKEKQDLEMRQKLAESSRYKSYRRYMKKGGPGQMTFGPE